QDILPHVRAVIDSGDDEVRLLVRQEGAERQENTVGGGAVYLVGPVGVAFRPDRATQREGVTGPALLAVGGDNGDPPDRPADVGEHGKPLGQYSVVVTDQDVQRAIYRPGC